MAQNTDCAVCLVEHEDELHEATLRVRAWFRYQVTLGFYELGFCEEVVEQAPDTEAA